MRSTSGPKALAHSSSVASAMPTATSTHGRAGSSAIGRSVSDEIAHGMWSARSIQRRPTTGSVSSTSTITPRPVIVASRTSAAQPASDSGAGEAMNRVPAQWWAATRRLRIRSCPETVSSGWPSVSSLVTSERSSDRSGSVDVSPSSAQTTGGVDGDRVLGPRAVDEHVDERRARRSRESGARVSTAPPSPSSLTTIPSVRRFLVGSSWRWPTSRWQVGVGFARECQREDLGVVERESGVAGDDRERVRVIERGLEMGAALRRSCRATRRRRRPRVGRRPRRR